MSRYANDVSEIDAVAAPSGDPLRDLFRRLAAGEREALGDLYDAAAPLLFGIALLRTGSRAAAEEVVQEAFLRLATTRADLATVRRPRAYLATVARHAAADHMRRHPFPHPIAPAEAERLVEPRPSDPDTRLDLERLNCALHELSPPQREAIVLRYLHELPLRDVARATGVPLFTAASRCRLGLARLRRLLSGRSR
jgi:RNA polymerase sigma-70 factor (ECF subfamily)